MTHLYYIAVGMFGGFFLGYLTAVLVCKVKELWYTPKRIKKYQDKKFKDF